MQSFTRTASHAAAQRVLAIEARAISALADRLDETFERAVSLVLECSGRVVVTGLGKSGHIGAKLAATLCSLSTPSTFVHAADALHGDAGAVKADDVVVALSNSGETKEVVAFAQLATSRGAPVVAMTGGLSSTLASAADVVLDAAVAEEADHLDLAPTASTTAVLALGDALAVAVAEARGVTREDFARNHPAGPLGSRLTG